MFALEKLENRQLLTASVIGNGLGSALVGAGNTGGTLDLGNYFKATATPNSIIHLATNVGPIDIQMLPGAAPQTVNNFINYVNSGAYDNTFFHRLIPGFVVQGGGFSSQTGGAIQANGPVQNEFKATTTVTASNVGIGDSFTITAKSTPDSNGNSTTIGTVSFTATDNSPASVAAGLAAAWNISTIDAVVSGNNLLLTPNNGLSVIFTASTTNGDSDTTQSLAATTQEINVAGTVAMAKLGGDPNSATDQWFINLADNSQNLDFQNGGFTVFGQIVNGTMSTVNGIGSLQTEDLSQYNGAFTDVPLTNDQNQNLITIEHASAAANYTLQNDNPGVATASITNSQLVITMGSAQGTVHITVTETDPSDNTTAQSVLTITNDTIGPTASIANSLVTPSTNSITFTVTYNDGVAVKASTLGNGNLTVTGPNGFSQQATLLSTGLSDSGQLVATYSVTAPQGGFNALYSGNYTISLASNSVTDTAGNAATAGSLGTIHASFTDAPPSATLVSAGAATRDAKTFNVTVQYNDDIAVSAATLGNDDLLVTGPNGYSAMGTLVSTGLTDGKTVTATYQFNAPGGYFSDADNGSYSMTIPAGSVKDSGGNLISSTLLGNFTVALNPAATAPDLASNIFSVGPTTLTPSSKNSIKYSITNSGNAIAKGKVPVKILVGGTVVATTTQSLSLKPGQTKQFTTKFSSPNLSEGDYNVQLVVDDTNALNEQYSSNNNSTLASTVHVLPQFVDLKASLSKLPTSLKAKGSVSVLVTNLGTVTAKGGSTIKLYAPTTQSVDDSALLVTLPKNLNIAAGKSTTVKLKLPSTIPTGNRYIMASVDFSGVDTDPSNNDVFSQSTVLLG